ncbi:MAG: type I restriction endonuclease, partial [Candidatus Babeliales bacterium]
MTPFFTEDHSVEQPAITLFEQLGWKVVNAYEEKLGEDGTLCRQTEQDVVLLPTLKNKLLQFNPKVPAEQIDEVLQWVSRDRSAMHGVRANKEVHQALRDGVDVEYRDDQGIKVQKTVRLMDWHTPGNNDFMLISQLWVAGYYGRRRPDLVGFINGIPVVLFELKKPGTHIYEAYQKNLSDYRDTIPQLFWYNGVIIVSNGADTKVGSLTAPWEHYSEWKKINDEDEPGAVSLETAVRGICEPSQLLDILENFILFQEERGSPKKLLARNHQYLGVNNALKAVHKIWENEGRLGVFWHTQGSGKSFSMVFLTQKILRLVPG